MPLAEASLSHCRLVSPLPSTRPPGSDWLSAAPPPGRAVAAAAAWRRRRWDRWRRRRRRRRWGFLPASASARPKRARRCATGRSARCSARPCCRCARRAPRPALLPWFPGPRCGGITPGTPPPPRNSTPVPPPPAQPNALRPWHSPPRPVPSRGRRFAGAQPRAGPDAPTRRRQARSALGPALDKATGTLLYNAAARLRDPKHLGFLVGYIVRREILTDLQLSGTERPREPLAPAGTGWPRSSPPVCLQPPWSM